MKFPNVFLLLFLLVWCCKSKKEGVDTTKNEDLKNPLAQFFKKELKPFYYGVASGDPLQDAVIIWTRIEPDTKNSEIEVVWQISKDSLFEKILQSGSMRTSANKDYTVKVDVKDLSPNNYYYYRFKSGDTYSVFGRTRTAPLDADRLKFAVGSCSNYVQGFFNAYGRIAEEKDLNAFIFLGDYIYEYGARKPEHVIANRNHIPTHEIVNLGDYRMRYAQYKMDEDLRNMHRAHPFISIWDDHEFANNAYVGGAQNHSVNEGDYQKRKNAAKQAYYEWLPIRESKTHYRSFDFGSLAKLIMLDERFAGRSKQLGFRNPQRDSDAHSILGRNQFLWLKEELGQTEAQWNLIGNQVIFSYQDFGDPNRRFSMDSWNGYPKEQKKVAELFRSNDLENIIILTGDTHSAWAFEATIDPFRDYNKESAKGAFGVELAVASINSGNHNEQMSDSAVFAHEKVLLDPNINPHLKYVNRRDHGYVLLTLTTNVAKAEYKIIPTRLQHVKGVSTDTSFTIQSGSSKLN